MAPSARFNPGLPYQPRPSVEPSVVAPRRDGRGGSLEGATSARQRPPNAAAMVSLSSPDEAATIFNDLRIHS